jgi:rsbT co-antagonist protein RsbR
MNEALKLFKQYLLQNEESLIRDFLKAIDQNQPETFLRLTHQTREIIYKKQLQELIHHLADTAVGESNQADIENWGREVSEDKVRLGLTLYQSIKHFNIIRSVIWEALEDLADRHEEIRQKNILKLGKFINEFIDDIILTFTNSYTGLTNKRLRAQQEVIDELSTPVISIVDGVAVLPIIGDIDTHRAKLLMEHTLKETSKQEVDCLILDLSGVFIVDTMVAQE